MEILPDVDIKAIVFGAAIAAAFIIFGYQYWDWFYPPTLPLSTPIGHHRALS